MNLFMYYLLKAFFAHRPAWLVRHRRRRRRFAGNVQYNRPSNLFK